MFFFKPIMLCAESLTVVRPSFHEIQELSIELGMKYLRRFLPAFMY